jgi:hypothetical protein
VFFGMLDCGVVTTASAAMKERVTRTFDMCALDAYRHAPTCFTCLKAFQVSRLHPLSLDAVLNRSEVRRIDDDPERERRRYS